MRTILGEPTCKTPGRSWSEYSVCWMRRASHTAHVVKNPPASAGDSRDTGLIPGLGRFPAGRNGNSLQNSCLENSMDGRAWLASPWGHEVSDTTLERIGCSRNSHGLGIRPPGNRGSETLSLCAFGQAVRLLV